MKKYSPISELGQFAGEYAETASSILDSIVIVSDTDHVVAASGVKKSDYLILNLRPPKLARYF